MGFQNTTLLLKVEDIINRRRRSGLSFRHCKLGGSLFLHWVCQAEVLTPRRTRVSRLSEACLAEVGLLS